ncbi:MAG TPA: hypothetical protein VN873_15940 [Candidatus Angelobacter sp.]|nr:hypothetical protein [Candidatus Angelobacter sp.]
MRALEIGRGGILDRAERLKEKVAKGIALYAIRLSREEIQKLPNLCCSETIHTNLKWFVEWDQWFQLERVILRSFRTVRKQEMNELRTRMLESQLDPNLLRSLSPRKRTEKEQKELFRRRDMILRAHWAPRERGKNQPKAD